MNALKCHIEYVATHWQDKTAALSLVDHVQELHDVDRLSALRYVVGVLREGKDAHHIAAAARKARRRSCTNTAVFGMLTETLRLSWYSDTRLLFVRGFARPRIAILDVMPDSAIYLGHIVSIGAREYLRMYRDAQSQLRKLHWRVRAMIQANY